MNELKRDKINGLVVLWSAFLCLILGGYWAVKGEILETVCFMGVSSILFSCACVVYSRYMLQTQMKDGFDRILDQLERKKFTGDTEPSRQTTNATTDDLDMVTTQR
jgi:hypothetical protein